MFSVNVYFHMYEHTWCAVDVFVMSNPAGSYPLAINLGVSSPGNHSLRIIIEDDEGCSEDNASYFIEGGSDPTGY